MDLPNLSKTSFWWTFKDQVQLSIDDRTKRDAMLRSLKIVSLTDLHAWLRRLLVFLFSISCQNKHFFQQGFTFVGTIRRCTKLKYHSCSTWKLQTYWLYNGGYISAVHGENIISADAANDATIIVYRSVTLSTPTDQILFPWTHDGDVDVPVSLPPSSSSPSS